MLRRARRARRGRPRPLTRCAGCATSRRRGAPSAPADRRRTGARPRAGAARARLAAARSPWPATRHAVGASVAPAPSGWTGSRGRHRWSVCRSRTRCPGRCGARRRSLGRTSDRGRPAGDGAEPRRRGPVLAVRQRARPGPGGRRRDRAADRARRRRARAGSRCSFREVTREGQAVAVALEERAMPIGWSARPRSSSARRSATCSPGCGCWPIRPTPPRSCGRSPARRSTALSRHRALHADRARRKLDMVGALAAAPSRRRSRRRRASASARSSSCYRAAARGSTRLAPTCMCTA